MPTLNLIPAPCHTPVISLRIRGIEHYFIIDTGSTATLIDPILVKDRDFKIINTGIITGLGADTPQVLRIAIIFRIITKTLLSVTVCNRMETIKGSLPYKISGLIGQDVLSQFTEVAFNYKDQTVRFTV